MEPSHLFVLIHGLWGNPSHMQYIAGQISKQFGNEAEVLVSKANDGLKTYDGINVCAERVLEEIRERLGLQRSLKSISVVGYSLGGLIGRYLVGLLEVNDFFGLEPINFVTLATPHLGARKRYDIVNRFISVFIGRSGAQIALKDPHNLLLVMSMPGSCFYVGLQRFHRRTVYANLKHDRTVGFETAHLSIACPDHLKKPMPDVFPSRHHPHIWHVEPMHSKDVASIEPVTSPSERSLLLAELRRSDGWNRYIKFLLIPLLPVLLLVWIFVIPITLVVIGLTRFGHRCKCQLHASLIRHQDSSEPDPDDPFAHIVNRDVIDTATRVACKGPDAVIDAMCSNLNSLGWCKVAVCLPPPSSHGHIIVRKERVNSCGKDVVAFMLHHLHHQHPSPHPPTQYRFSPDPLLLADAALGG